MAHTPNPLDLLDDATRRRLEERFAACGNSHKPFHSTIEECALDIIRARARDPRSLTLPAHVWRDGRPPYVPRSAQLATTTTTGTDNNR